MWTISQYILVISVKALRELDRSVNDPTLISGSCADLAVSFPFDVIETDIKRAI